MIEQRLLSFALLGAAWVLWVLIGLSVLSFAVMLERGRPKQGSLPRERFARE